MTSSKFSTNIDCSVREYKSTVRRATFRWHDQNTRALKVSRGPLTKKCEEKFQGGRRGEESLHGGWAAEKYAEKYEVPFDGAGRRWGYYIPPSAGLLWGTILFFSSHGMCFKITRKKIRKQKERQSIQLVSWICETNNNNKRPQQQTHTSLLLYLYSIVNRFAYFSRICQLFQLPR